MPLPRLHESNWSRASERPFPQRKRPTLGHVVDRRHDVTPSVTQQRPPQFVVGKSQVDFELQQRPDDDSRPEKHNFNNIFLEIDEADLT